MITDAKYVAERDRRVALLDKLMVDTRVDALVLTSTAQQAYQIATKYVSGYQLTTRRDFVFMKPGEMPRLIIPTVGQQFHARRLSWLPDENIYCGPMVETVRHGTESIDKRTCQTGIGNQGHIQVNSGTTDLVSIVQLPGCQVLRDIDYHVYLFPVQHIQCLRFPFLTGPIHAGIFHPVLGQEVG